MNTRRCRDSQRVRWVLPHYHGHFREARLAAALRRSGVSIVRSMVTSLINAAYHGNEPMVLTPNLVAILSQKERPEPTVRSA